MTNKEEALDRYIIFLESELQEILDMYSVSEIRAINNVHFRTKAETIFEIINQLKEL